MPTAFRALSLAGPIAAVCVVLDGQTPSRGDTGLPLTVSYATSGYHGSQDHTGTQIRVAAQGPQSAGVLGVIDQTDLFRLIARALQIPGPVSSSRPEGRTPAR